MVMMFVVGRISGKVQPKYMIVAGALIIALSMYDLTNVYGDLGFWFMARSRMLLGVGLPLIFLAITTASYDGIPPRRAISAGRSQSPLCRTCSRTIRRPLAKVSSVLKHLVSLRPLPRLKSGIRSRFGHSEVNCAGGAHLIILATQSSLNNSPDRSSPPSHYTRFSIELSTRSICLCQTGVPLGATKSD